MRVNTEFRKAPIEDLLKYLDEIYLEEILPNEPNFLTFIEKYYRGLTDYDISLPNELVMPVWCERNYCKDLELCPIDAGLLLYRNLNGREEFGITFIGTLTNHSVTFQKSKMWCWRTNRKGDLSREIFCIYDWDAWGYMDAYFTYPEKEFKQKYPFGLHELKLHDSGYEVILLQQMLQKFDSSAAITGYFDETTQTIVSNLQSAFSLEPTGKLQPDELVKVAKLIYGGK